MPRNLTPDSGESSLSALLLPFTTLRVFQQAFSLQQETVKRFYKLAETVSSPGCPVGPPPEGMLNLERNVFSTLFLGVTARLVRSDHYLPLYAMVNHCMRAGLLPVTTCWMMNINQPLPFLKRGLGSGCAPSSP